MNDRPSYNCFSKILHFITKSNFLIAIIPIIISLIALLLSAQTYYASHRPYVGIIEHDYQIIQDQNEKSVGLAWVFVMKNVGATPAVNLQLMIQ